MSSVDLRLIHASVSLEQARSYRAGGALHAARTELVEVLFATAAALGLSEREQAVIRSMLTARETGGVPASELEMGARIDVCDSCRERQCLCIHEAFPQ